MRGGEEGRVKEINLEVPDQALLRLSQERLLALDLREMKAIQNYLRNTPALEGRKKLGLGKSITDVELEAIARPGLSTANIRSSMLELTIRFEFQIEEKGGETF